jgi:hypothetical protein
MSISLASQYRFNFPEVSELFVFIPIGTVIFSRRDQVSHGCRAISLISSSAVCGGITDG